MDTSRLTWITSTTIVLLFIVAILIDLLMSPSSTAQQTQRAQAYLTNAGLTQPDQAFSHDGCTLFPDRFLGHDLTEACLAHDIQYWAGGSDALRRSADLAFYQAITHTGPLGPTIASLTYYGVRLFGDSGLTKVLNAHWGYGRTE